MFLTFWGNDDAEPVERVTARDQDRVEFKGGLGARPSPPSTQIWIIPPPEGQLSAGWN
ncbi:hypothetical protein [Micromonospora sp. KC723]|uniref:hypothetical protein n=1 Tax=Micromonospora sp. KC723 TaxID=2530381 RepID=UPI001405528F|nr:hypothetical protein [Micromonospora sp. KC723]